MRGRLVPGADSGPYNIIKETDGGLDRQGTRAQAPATRAHATKKHVCPIFVPRWFLECVSVYVLHPSDSDGCKTRLTKLLLRKCVFLEGFVVILQLVMLLKSCGSCRSCSHYHGWPAE